MRYIKRSGSRAFTLTELLVAIGIITVLLAILLPTLGRAREHAYQIECLNNEKQIGAAIFLYCNDNHFQLPLMISPYPPNQTPFEAICMVRAAWLDYENGVLWRYISPQILTRERIFNCPSDPDPKIDNPGLNPAYSGVPRNFSYCLTYELNKCSMGPPIAPLLLGDTARGFYGIHAMPITMVRHPEHKLLVIEDYAPGGISGGDDVYYPHSGGSISALTSRHSGKANIGFFDGHCEPIDPATFSGIMNDRTVINYWIDVLDGGGVPH